MKSGKSLPIMEQWMLMMRFKDDAEREEFHKLLRSLKGNLKNWNIEFGGKISEFEFPIVRVSKRETRKD